VVALEEVVVVAEEAAEIAVTVAPETGTAPTQTVATTTSPGETNATAVRRPDPRVQVAAAVSTS
jgi:hypothetical protein